MLYSPALHPVVLLVFLVKERLPAFSASSHIFRDFYSTVLEDQEGTILKCLSLMQPWVLAMFEEGTLYNAQELKKISVPDNAVPQTPGIYVCMNVIQELGTRYYCGQSNNLHRRIVLQHKNKKNRNLHPSLNGLYIDHAEETLFLLPVVDESLESGPMLNLLEQWNTVIFRSLQPRKMKANLSKTAFEALTLEELDAGANLAEPLFQSVPFTYKFWNFRLFESNDPIKREYSIYREEQETQDSKRLEQIKKGIPIAPAPPPPTMTMPQYPYWIRNGKIDFVRERVQRADKGEVLQFSRGYWPYTYQVDIKCVRIIVPKANIDRYEPDTIRIKLDLKPPGEIHPNAWVPKLYMKEMIKYNDPASRLGIRVSGTYKGGWDHIIKDGFFWVESIGASHPIHQANRIVDWMEGRSLEVEFLLPRRFYIAREFEDTGKRGASFTYT